MLRSLQFWLLRSIVVIVIVYLLIVLLLVVVIWNQDHPDLFPKRNEVFESAEESQHGWNSNCSFNSTHNSATYNHLSEQQVSATTGLFAKNHIYIGRMLEIQGACWNGWHETKTAYLWPSKLACGFLRVHKGSQGCMLRSIWGSMLGYDRCPSSKSLRSLWLDCTLTKYSPNSSSHVTWQSTGCNSVNWKTALVQVWMSGGYGWRRPAESHLGDKQWVKTRPQYKHWHRHTI